MRAAMLESFDAKLDISELTKRFDRTLAVDRASFQVADGEFFTLLGPSGCGKSTILGMIAGIVQPDGGRIALDGRDITREPIFRRDVALVFQQYALFPHMTVYDNVAFGLRMRRIGSSELTRRVREVLALVQLHDHDRKYPGQLSGGQQQRVALARAIVVRPRLVLLDEPMSNLDAKLRAELRSELRDIQRATQLTTVFVTHDLNEAFEMSDRVAVMADGRIQQIGTPIELYERPGSIFVAQFLGHSNHFPAIVSDREGVGSERSLITADGRTLRARPDDGQTLGVGDRVWIVLPADRLSLAGMLDEGANHVDGSVTKVVFLGKSFRYVVRCAEHLLQVEMPSGTSPGFATGDHVQVTWRPADCILIKMAGT
jgi:putative spermidine/putrescine transport system ATP-binding protein